MMAWKDRKHNLNSEEKQWSLDHSSRILDGHQIWILIGGVSRRGENISSIKSEHEDWLSSNPKEWAWSLSEIWSQDIGDREDGHNILQITLKVEDPKSRRKTCWQTHVSKITQQGHMECGWHFPDLHIEGVKGMWHRNSWYVNTQWDLTR